MEKISVIISVYNTEIYVRKCIESILIQTYKNIEIIIIDDGSKDDSGKICEEFLVDNRVKIFHQNNQGTSCARNYGLKNVTGKYICFVDSDDYVEKDYIEFLYNLITKFNTDIAVCGFDYAYTNNKFRCNNKKKKNKTIILNNEQALIKMCDFNDCFMPICCNKIYKSELFKDINFPEGKKFEDLCLNIDIIKKAKRIVYNSKVKYHYFVDRYNSSTKSMFTEKEYDVIKFCEKLRENISEKDNIIIHGFYLANMIDICNKLIDIGKINNSIFIKTQKMSRYKLFNLLISKYMIQRKINALFFSINYKLYIKYYKIKRILWKKRF